jgi:sulfatase maturation enzyme AslB (radical SAM superfamily)
LNVTVALGIDGPKAEHEKIRQKPGSWDIAIDTARQLQSLKKSFPRLDIQTCTCFMNSNQDTIFEWYDFLKYNLQPDRLTSTTFVRLQRIPRNSRLIIRATHNSRR